MGTPLQLVKSSLSISIAEDDPDQRDVLARFVEILGHRVVCAVEDGHSLLAAITDQETDLALVDFDMPLLDGLTAAEELSRTRNIPVILISGHPDLRHVVWENEPVAASITKPVTLEQLSETIHAVMEQRSGSTE